MFGDDIRNVMKFEQEPGQACCTCQDIDMAHLRSFSLPIIPFDERKIIINNSNNKYTVTFDSSGGSKVTTQIVSKNLKAKEPSKPIKEFP